MLSDVDWWRKPIEIKTKKYKSKERKGDYIMKTLKFAFAALLSLTLFTGCGTSSSSEKPLVSVAQIVEHKSLNQIRDSFKEEMETLGYKDGENVTLDFKDAGNQQNTLNSIMSTFAGNESDVIVAIATPTAMSAANYANDIPIIFSAVSDPVGANLVTDPTKPDKNITGTSDEIQVDQILALAKEIDPDLKTLGFIYNSGEANSVTNLAKAKEYCEANNIELIEGSGKNIGEIQSAISVLVNKCDAIFAPNDNTVASSMDALVQSANEKKVPVYTGADSMVSDGGFATVGIDYTELGKETARMVDQVLKGTDIKDIPVKVFKDDLSVYVNKKTMEEIGIKLPDSITSKDNFVLMGE